MLGVMGPATYNAVMRLLLQLKLSRTSLIICALASFLIGIALARQKLAMKPIEVILVFAATIIIFSKYNVWSLLCLCLLSGMLGIWRGTSYLSMLGRYENLYGQKVTLVGRADNDGNYSKGSQLEFDLVGARVANQPPLIGKISVRGYGENALYHSDKVQVSGKIYPTLGSRQARMSYVQIKVLSRSNSAIDNLRRRFESGMLSALPEPMASFAVGLLIGQRSNLSKQVSDNLSTVGLTHVVAVSGYNLTIIISAAYLLLKKFSKYQATVISIILILLFILFTGTSASIVRAAIVSMLSLWAGFYGRNFKPVLLVLLAAAVTAGWSPSYLWSDIGWYLSFLAFFGILVLAPLWLNRRPNLSLSTVSVVMTETVAAQLMTTPIIMYIFGEVSLIALPANVLIVPLVPLAMVLSFAAALAGMLVPALAGWIALPARLLLTYMLDVVALIAKIPNALSAKSLNLVQMIAAYLMIILACIIVWLLNRRKNAIITDEE